MKLPYLFHRCLVFDFFFRDGQVPDQKEKVELDVEADLQLQ